LEIINCTKKPVEDRIFDACDQVLDIFRFAGIADIEEIFDAIGLRIVYDPENESGYVKAEGRGAYLWSSHAVYTGDAGINVSLMHEFLHALDTEAAPTPEQFLPVFSKRKAFVPWIHRSVWIINGVSGDWLGEADTLERLFFEEAIMSPLVTLNGFNASLQNVDIFQLPQAEIAKFVRYAIDQDATPALSAVRNTKKKSVEFVAERFVDLVDYFLALRQQQAGMQPYGFPMSYYAQEETFWMPEWVEYHQEKIVKMLTARVEIIRGRIADGSLADMHEYQKSVIEVINPGIYMYPDDVLVEKCKTALMNIDRNSPWHWRHFVEHIHSLTASGDVS
jgi:hypothetical protein